jgi:hypothetical protein
MFLSELSIKNPCKSKNWDFLVEKNIGKKNKKKNKINKKKSCM